VQRTACFILLVEISLDKKWNKSPSIQLFIYPLASLNCQNTRMQHEYTSFFGARLCAGFADMELNSTTS
jgi:hypothetical protein